MGGCASAPIEFKKDEAPVEPEEQAAVTPSAKDEKSPSLGALLKEDGEGKEVEEEKKEEAAEDKKSA
ncbi:hypothetical protein MLD38_023194 [Melastoma candidum]|uniref:Uncharacterized protein n=1 Tax=Melastoma candidum TaxID=119954 RepID=A0ACB9QMY0_9MYRT|nr:hypothetical protein MLD38_023194 [Melastoma candidum]